MHATTLILLFQEFYVSMANLSIPIEIESFQKELTESLIENDRRKAQIIESFSIMKNQI